MAVINPKIKVLCDSIMGLIVDAGPSAKFGVSGIVASFEHKATQDEVCEAIEVLFALQHIRRLGAYVFGLGTGIELNEYDFDDYSPSAYFPKPEDKLEQYRAMLSQLLPKHKKKSKPKPVEQKKIKQDLASVPVVNSDVAIVVYTKQSADVRDAIKDLEQQLTSSRIEELATKCDVLSDLSRLLDPRISRVLNSIKSDLTTISGGGLS